MTKEIYHSDWIENTGVAPIGITKETILDVVYVDEVCLFARNNWEADFYWEQKGCDTDIDMYRYVYSTTEYKGDQNDQ